MGAACCPFLESRLASWFGRNRRPGRQSWARYSGKGLSSWPPGWKGTTSGMAAFLLFLLLVVVAVVVVVEGEETCFLLFNSCSIAVVLARVPTTQFSPFNT